MEACQAHHCVLVTASPGAPLKPSVHIFRACLHFSGSARCGPQLVAPLSWALPPLAAALPVLAVGGMCNVHTSPPGTLPHRIHGYHSRCTAVSTRPTLLPPAMVALAAPTTGSSFGGNQGHARRSEKVAVLRAATPKQAVLWTYPPKVGFSGQSWRTNKCLASSVLPVVRPTQCGPQLERATRWGVLRNLRATPEWSGVPVTHLGQLGSAHAHTDRHTDTMSMVP